VKTFDEHESELETRWAARNHTTAWQEAKHAVRDAWERARGRR
jgi:hypothetical protein